jgi:hypothetical protein
MIAAPIDVPRASGFIPDKIHATYFMSRIQVRYYKKTEQCSKLFWNFECLGKGRSLRNFCWSF